MRVSKTKLVRLEMWSSVALAVLFQLAFLLELHSPLPSDLVLWSLSAVSVACLVVFVLARQSLVTEAKVRYGHEGARVRRSGR
jgi:hypothetical protein